MFRWCLGCAFAAALALTAGVGQAKTVLYDCIPSSGREDSLIQPQILIAHDPETGEVVVTDPVILHVYGKPIAGKVQSDSATRIIFDWHIKRLHAGSESAALDYRARYFKADGRLSLSVTAVGYGEDSDIGHCTKSALPAGKKAGRSLGQNTAKK